MKPKLKKQIVIVLVTSIVYMIVLALLNLIGRSSTFSLSGILIQGVMFGLLWYWISGKMVSQEGNFEK